MNVKLLKSKMALHGDTVVLLADALGISRSRLSQKINSKANFNSPEIKAIAARYNLNPKEVIEVFGLIEGD